MSFVLWITGPLGSGKTTVTKELVKILEDEGVVSIHLELDQLRTHLTPHPKYTEEERDWVYRALAFGGMLLWRQDQNVIIDATAHRRKWRGYAKEIMPGLLEVYTKCPIDICIRRETERHKGTVMGELYEKAMDRLQTGEKIEGLGQVPGVDVPYEEPDNPDIVVETDRHSPRESARLVVEELRRRNLLSSRRDQS